MQRVHMMTAWAQTFRRIIRLRAMIAGTRFILALLAGTAGLHGQMAFDVASVKSNKSDAPPSSNFPLNSGDFYNANGGLFSATNWPLVTYIFFAYKLQGNQGLALVSQLPSWVMNDRFDIQARASGNPAKDQMRAMMRTLLAERFRFAVHSETREIPVLAFVLAKPGSTGSGLRPHPAGASCDATPGGPVVGSDGLPAACGGILGLPASVPGRSRLGGRNLTIGFIADLLSQRVNPGRPMIDATGLQGTFDFLLEFTPDTRSTAPAVANAPARDPEGPTFEQALRDQLGVKLESRRSRMEMLVLDHVERPTEN